ncbi:MAG: flavodoxin domain-containing protein [Pleomorphochaeta sp.]
MKGLIIFASYYGSSKRYAKELSNRLSFDLIEYNKLNNTDDYSTIIYVGGLYAVGILGLKDVINKRLINFDRQKVVIASVGLSDPLSEENVDNINKELDKLIEKKYDDIVKRYYLRGSIDYKRLSIKHKIMMKALFLKVNKIPKDQRTKENIEFLETFDSTVDFVDFNTLNAIVDFIKK